MAVAVTSQRVEAAACQASSLESLHEPAIAEVEAAWGGEIERRLAEYDRCESKSIDAAEVFAKARSMAR